MEKRDEIILKVVKEIAIKFIETNRISPQNFDETWRQIYRTVRDGMDREKK
ncbi:MAG: hypothetical protein KJ621_12380 [Proteobacteria bacterium]|nr:hypothetical protein [Pseudomonadota bacterium]